MADRLLTYCGYTLTEMSMRKKPHNSYRENQKCKKIKKNPLQNLHLCFVYVFHLVITAARLEHLAYTLSGACTKGEGSNLLPCTN